MKTRCFIAINLSDEIKKEIGFLIEKLKEKNKSQDIKWVRPEGIHLTLHFLGYLDEGKIKQVEDIIQKSFSGIAPTEIELKNLDAFPNLKNPRVLFLSGQERSNNKFLNQLQIKIGQELEKIGIEIDKRLWQIHFTLARLNGPAPLQIANLCELQIKTFQVKSLELMKSKLQRDGASYSIIKSFKI
jgi:RNA 2',3'-cyclic 3'-phosphodiesterase